FTGQKWSETADQLRQAEREGPATLDGDTVERAWRNLQRELRSIQLRRAVSLWKAGQRDAALPEAERSRRSDEEFVRSGSILLLAAGDLSAGRVDAAAGRLHALAGHDPRLETPIDSFADALSRGRDPAASLAALRETLESEDRAQAFVAAPL